MFRLPSDAKEWYEKIPLDKKTPLFSEEWDLYYLCLLYGISEDAVDNKAERIDMAKNFTKKYKHAKDILVPLLMLNHAKKRKKRLDDKDTLQKILEKYYDPEHESNTSLSTEAINEMNLPPEQQAMAPEQLLRQQAVAVWQAVRQERGMAQPESA